MLKNLKTDPEIGINIGEQYWGRGYGKKVLKALKSRAKQMGIATLSLLVRPANKRAVNLYKQAGYTTEFLKMKKKIK